MTFYSVPKSPFKTLVLTNYFEKNLSLTKFQCFFTANFVVLLTEKERNLAFPNAKLTNFNVKRTPKDIE